MIGCYLLTGKVWKSHFDNGDDPFADKKAELLYPSDVDSRQRLRNEFNVYLIIEADINLCDYAIALLRVAMGRLVHPTNS